MNYISLAENMPGCPALSFLKKKSQKVYREKRAIFTGLSLPDSQVRLL
jgi:hypothetical protein